MLPDPSGIVSRERLLSRYPASSLWTATRFQFLDIAPTTSHSYGETHVGRFHASELDIRKHVTLLLKSLVWHRSVVVFNSRSISHSRSNIPSQLPVTRFTRLEDAT